MKNQVEQNENLGENIKIDINHDKTISGQDEEENEEISRQS